MPESNFNNMVNEIKLGSSLFGYDTIVKDGDRIITLKGDRITELDVGMEVVLLGDSRGYVPSNFKPGEKVTIIEFTEPFLNFHSDDIIKVSNGSLEGWVKPSNIQVKTYRSNLRPQADAKHRRVKNKVGLEFAEFMDIVYKSMSDTDRANLPFETMDYVNAIVAYALDKLPDFGDKLAYTVAKVYEADLHVRFIRDPLRSDENTEAYLYLDKEGYLISVINPEIVNSPSTPIYRYLKDFDFYIVLNGPFAGKQFYSYTHTLEKPLYRPEITNTFQDLKLKTVSSGDIEQQPIRVFISYSHKDEKFKDELIEHLSGLKSKKIISDWTDRKIHGGERWDDRIKKNLEDSKIILFLVSASFMNSSYINEIEIQRSIERHEKGEAIVIPIILKYCDFNSLPLHEFQALPKNAKPIEDWKPRTKGWLDVVNQLKDVIINLK